MKPHLKKTYHTIRSNPKYLFISIFLDILFLFTLALTLGAIQYRVMLVLSEIFEIIKDRGLPQTVFSNEASMMEFLSKTADFGQYYDKLLLYLILMLSSVYIIYTIFQGVNFSLASKLLKKPFNRYFQRFIIINIPWAAIFFSLLYLGIRLSLYSSTNLFPLIGLKTVWTIMFILYLAFFYFVFISYGLIQKHTWFVAFRESFKKGIKEPQIIPRYLLVSFSILISTALIIYIARYSFSVSLALLFILVLPIVFYSRVFFMSYIDSIKI